jgi:hypothetical protein
LSACFRRVSAQPAGVVDLDEQVVPSKLFRIGNICAVFTPFALPEGAYADIFLVSTMSKR